MKLIKQAVHKLGGVIFLFLMTSSLYAYEIVPASHSTSLGEAADNMLGPIDLVRRALASGAVIIGVWFIMNAFFRYQRFRQNPQESPLSSVFIYIILGVVFIVTPLVYHLSVTSAIHEGMSDVAL